MTRIKEKSVACHPFRVAGIIYQKTAVKHIDEIGSAHGASGMSGFCLLHHFGYKDADIVGASFQDFCIHDNLDSVFLWNI